MASTPEKTTHHSSCFVSSQSVPLRRQAASAAVSPATAAAEVAVQDWSGVSSSERRDDQSIKKAAMASLIRPQPSTNASTKGTLSLHIYMSRYFLYKFIMFILDLIVSLELFVSHFVLFKVIDC